MGLDHHRIPPSQLRRRLAVECADLVHGLDLEPVTPYLTSYGRLVRALAACELSTLYDLRNRLAGVPRIAPAETPA